MFARMNRGRSKFRVVVTIFGIAAGVAQCLAVPGAGASDAGVSGAGASGASDHGNTVTVIVTTRLGTPGGSGSPGSSGSTGGDRDVYVCSYTPAPPSLTTGLETGGPEAGQFYIVRCTGPGIPPGSSIIVWLANDVLGAPEGITPSNVAQRAASSIVLPSPVIRTNPAGSTFVNIPTWLWINSSVWHSRTARASLAGITVTATATPVTVSFATGDGAHVVCHGPGAAYNTSEPLLEQSTTCSHSYASSSAGQASGDGNPNDAAFALQATITWSVTWRGVGFSQGGSLPPLTTSATTSLRVEQIESLQRS